MESPKEMQVTKFDLFEGTCALNFTVTLPPEMLKNKAVQQKSILLVIDISGSMSGTPLSQVKQALGEFVEFLFANQMGEDITLVTFNQDTNVTSWRGQNAADIRRAINGMQAGGGTNFVGVFNQLRNWFRRPENEGRNAAIVFFTDGQDGYMQFGPFGPFSPYNPDQRKRELTESLTALSSVIKTRKGVTEVHSFGFSADHDAVLLEQITRLGNSKGNFQFIAETAMIQQCVRTVCDSVLDVNVSAELSVQYIGSSILQNYPIYLGMVDDARPNVFEGFVFVPNAAKTVETCTLKLKVGKNVETHIVRPVAVEARVGDIRLIEAVVMYIKETILRYTTAFGRKDPSVNTRTAQTVVESLGKRLEEARTSIQLITSATMQQVSGAAKVSARETRKRLFTLCQEAADLLAQFYSALLTQRFTNAEIATITTMAYKNVSKQGLRKKMDQRLSENEEKLRADDVAIDEYVAALDFESLKEMRKQDIERYGECMLSKVNFLEALQDSSCLCLGLDVWRPEAAIADPSQVKVNGIATVVLTDVAFDEALQFTLKRHGDDKSRIAFAKGTAGGEDAVLVGGGRERITAVMPLYICQEHWQVARKRLRWCLGYLATADKLGYTFQQIVTVPFLVLARCIQQWLEHPSEHTEKVMGWVFRTCQAILTDFKIEVCNIEQYVRTTAVRTKDVMPSNLLYCAQLLAARPSLTPILAQQFCLALCEEELRRYEKEVTDAEWLALLGGPLAEHCYITPFVENFRRQQEALVLERSRKMSSGLGRGIRALLGETDEDLIQFTPAEETPKQKDTLDNLETEFVMNLKGNPLIVRNVAQFQSRCIPLLQLLTSLGLIDKELMPKTLMDLGDDISLTALIMQNVDQLKNTDRREATERNKYYSFWQPENVATARKMLYDRLRHLIVQERNARCAQIAAANAARMSGSSAEIFGRTDDIYEAAGALQGAFQGTNMMDFVRVLQRERCPLGVEKIKMLLTGQFRGIKLIADQSKQAVNGFMIWYPCPINRKRLMRQYNLSWNEFQELYN